MYRILKSWLIDLVTNQFWFLFHVGGGERACRGRLSGEAGPPVSPRSNAITDLIYWGFHCCCLETKQQSGQFSCLGIIRWF